MRSYTKVFAFATWMPAGGRLLVIEPVVPRGDVAHYKELLDPEMLVSPGGVERAAGEYRELFAAAGLRPTRMIPTRSPCSIIEVVAETHADIPARRG